MLEIYLLSLKPIVYYTIYVYKLFFMIRLFSKYNMTSSYIFFIPRKIRFRSAWIENGRVNCYSVLTV